MGLKPAADHAGQDLLSVTLTASIVVSSPSKGLWRVV